MLEATKVQWIIFGAVVLVLLLAPGYDDRPPPERPKRGFWQARDILWPIRKVLRSLWPRNPELLKAYRLSLANACLLAGVTNAAVDLVPGFAKTMSPVWILVECAVLGLLLGRAWGFWSADRRLKSEAHEPVETT